MPLVTVSSKHQITLPAEIVRTLGIHGGDKLALEAIDGRIVAIPEPASWVDYVRGSARGVYGGSREAIDRYVAEERAAWYDTTPSGADDFADYYVAHQGQMVQQVVDELARRPHHAGAAAAIAAGIGLSPDRVVQVLDGELVSRGWVRRIDAAEGTLYRLRHELASAIGAA